MKQSKQSTPITVIAFLQKEDVLSFPSTWTTEMIDNPQQEWNQIINLYVYLVHMYTKAAMD